MASSSDSWMKEYNEAVKLADDISGMISEQNSFPTSGPEKVRDLSISLHRICYTCAGRLCIKSGVGFLIREGEAGSTKK